MMECDATPPQSVFNIQHANMVRFLNGQRSKHQRDEETSLYSHQVEAVLDVREYFASQAKNNHSASNIVDLFAPQAKYNPNDSNIALVVLPTGCGKTGVAVLASYALNASRVLVITPSIIISRQIATEYHKFLIDRGIIADTPENVQRALPTVSLIKKSTEIEEGMKSMVMVVNAHKIGGQSNVRIEDIPREGYDLVIVDEAHHYPAPTWKLLVDHFDKSKRLFLTATPEHRGERILPNIPLCYVLKRSVAVDRGIIRNVKFDDDIPMILNEQERYQAIAERMEDYLDKHDEADPTVKHQGMVLTQTKQGINPAEIFCDIYNELFPDSCAVYVSETRKDILDAFIAGDIRVLVIIGRLLEGFDHSPVSVLGIVRNVAPTSRVLFAQFVGRAVRKNSPNDPVPAQIVTHKCFKQRQNYDTFEQLPEVEPSDDDN